MYGRSKVLPVTAEGPGTAQERPGKAAGGDAEGSGRCCTPNLSDVM